MNILLCVIFIVLIITVLLICSYVEYKRKILERKFDILDRLFLLYNNNVDDDYDYVNLSELLFVMEDTPYDKCTEGEFNIYTFNSDTNIDKFYIKDNNIVKISKDGVGIFMLKYNKLCAC